MKEIQGTDFISNPPDPARIMDGLRDTGYDFNTAVADIIDNSIAAGADNVVVHVLSTIDGVVVSVADDGCGMDLDGLKNAMRYGSDMREDPSSLGKFGLGLKTASTAFCRRLSVISRDNPAAEALKVTWDLDYIAQTRGWNLLRQSADPEEIEFLDEAAAGGPGTLVLWENIDRLFPKEYARASDMKGALTRRINGLKFHISLVYQRFIDPDDQRERNVRISVNDEPVQPWDPFCTTEQDTELLADEEIEIEYENDPDNPAALRLRAYLLPRKEEFSSPEAAKRARISNQMQGFYVYRENRLIHYGDWMGMYTLEPHGSLLRVEFSFDHKLDKAFNVDIKKSRVMLNEDIYNFLKDEFLPAPRRAANDRYRNGTKKKVSATGRAPHDPANQNIDEKAPAIEESRTRVINASTNEVEISNRNGTFRSKITIHKSADPKRRRVIPVDSIESGVLWEPSIAGDRKSVSINMSHPYYEKIYYPLLNRSQVIVTGMDALLWALAEAELSTFNDATKESYEDMRIQVSRALRRLVEDLPEPDFGDED